MRALVVTFPLAGIGLLIGAALAQSPSSAPGAVPWAQGAATANADANRGRFVAMGGLIQHNRVSCVQCHGLDGVGDSSGAFPRLSGLGGWYLYKSLQDYAAGLRPDEIMGPIARLLKEQEKQDVAAYYASLPATAQPGPANVGIEVLQIGGAISAVGVPQQGVPACAGCHGPSGVGSNPIYPALAGQYAAYTEQQLFLWKRGVRDGDPMDIMELIAKAMTEDQIRAVSLYFASIEPAQAHRSSNVQAAPIATAPPQRPQPPYLPGAAAPTPTGTRGR